MYSTQSHTRSLPTAASCVCVFFCLLTAALHKVMDLQYFNVKYCQN